MACFRPFVMQERANGTLGFADKPGDRRALQLACGRCIGCRLDRATAWSVRCLHEASLYDRNSFVTLTYDDDRLPPGGGLRYRDVQLFLKRLRKGAKERVRFFAAGEYGSTTGRPHYHLLLFNHDFPDAVRAGKAISTSQVLSDLWPHGFASCGSLTPASAAYVSQYSMKKVYGRVEAEEHYQGRRPEFIVMSRRPGIGAEWYEKFAGDVLPRDYVVSNGRKVQVPRYYADKFKSLFPEDFDVVVESRERESLERARGDSGRSRDSRLRAAEEVTRARHELFSERGL